MKIFIIAFFSVSMLGKKISCMQWTAVGLLAVAVALVQVTNKLNEFSLPFMFLLANCLVCYNK